MKHHKRLVMLLVVLACLAVMVPGLASASDLVTVKVNIVIDNPDYFWQYPFDGKGADGILVSGMGKKSIVEAASAGRTLTFEVPKSYQFRMSLDVCNKSAVLKSLSFIKNDINKDNSTFTIILKAPAPEQIKVEAKEFDDIK